MKERRPSIESRFARARSQRHAYFSCRGGPHLLLPGALLPSWTGAEYDRACATPAPIGQLAVGRGTALVLGHAPSISSWSRSVAPDDVDLFVLSHWSKPDLDALVDRAQSIPAASLRDTRITWTVPRGSAYLMSAGDRGERPAYEPVRVPVRRGSYSVWKGTFKSLEGTVSVFRLVRLT